MMQHHRGVAAVRSHVTRPMLFDGPVFLCSCYFFSLTLRCLCCRSRRRILGMALGPWKKLPKGREHHEKAECRNEAKWDKH